MNHLITRSRGSFICARFCAYTFFLYNFIRRTGSLATRVGLGNWNDARALPSRSRTISIVNAILSRWGMPSLKIQIECACFPVRDRGSGRESTRTNERFVLVRFPFGATVRQFARNVKKVDGGQRRVPVGEAFPRDGKGIQCLQMPLEITRNITIDRGSQIASGRYAMSSSSYACRVGRKNRFYLMTDYLLCSPSPADFNVLFWFQ